MIRGRYPATHLADAAISPDVLATVGRWRQASGSWVLIGAVALAFYSRPRYTQDVDILTLSLPDETPSGFARARPDLAWDALTRVEVKIHTPAAIGIPTDLAEQIVANAVVLDGMKIASLAAMVALKLYAADNPKRHYGELQDILNMMSHNLDESWEMLLSGWPIGAKYIERLSVLRSKWISFDNH